MEKKLTTAAMVVVAAVALQGCNVVRDLRTLFHPDEAAVTEVPPDKAGLTVTVTPKTGISVLIDGKKVASASPFRSNELAPGPHTLTLRAMGYHAIQLPLLLPAGRVVEIPVTLRRRADAPMKAHGAARPLGSPGAPPSRVRTPPPLPRAPAPPLPAGVEPVRLKLVPTPSRPVVIDGIAASSGTITIERVHGSLTAGDVSLAYRVGGSGTFELTIPPDGALWIRDGAPLPEGAVFMLHMGTTRLEREGPAGQTQGLLIRRL